MNRLHPHDLRAIMAAVLGAGALADPSVSDIDPKGAAERTDALMAELERTAQPVPGWNGRRWTLPPSPGLEPPRPITHEIDRLVKEGADAEWWRAYHWGESEGMAQAKAEVDRLQAALDLEAKARSAMAEGLAEAKDERDRLMATFNLLLPILEEGADSGMVPRGDTIRALAHVKDLLIGQHPGPDPTIRADDLVEALDDDPEPRGGFHEGHDTFEERDGER